MIPKPRYPESETRERLPLLSVLLCRAFREPGSLGICSTGGSASRRSPISNAGSMPLGPNGAAFLLLPGPLQASERHAAKMQGAERRGTHAAGGAPMRPLRRPCAEGQVDRSDGVQAR